ncbi:RNA-dependent RNA polymerase [Aphelenchoides fujianensis]|nr:RNA-dependent RNA polymerase [Aphelenchoides fujianensis]
MAAIQLASRTTSPIGFQQVARAGIRITDEPFLRQMLFAIYRYCICQDMIKASLKIPIPPSAGRTMYGVIDELGYLNPGQVFVQYSPNIHIASNVCRPFVGQVMISKNPCHVPGDVRLFDAVFVPELSHLRDVVVFPPLWCSARTPTRCPVRSDLDGDEYTVIFEDDLFIDHNEPPMSFPEEDSRRSGRARTPPVCESIAAKCSIAVDFPKTGEPADPLADSERFNDTPDFMSLEAAEASMFAQAITVRDLYYAKLQQLLDEYAIESEAEALSGHASFIRRISDMEKSDYSFYHADRLVEMRMTKIREKFREEFFDECGGEAAVFQPGPNGPADIVKALSLGQTLPPVTSALYPHLDETRCTRREAFDRRHLISLVVQFGLGTRKCADQFVMGDVFLPVRVESMDAARQLKAAENPPPELRETSRFPAGVRPLLRQLAGGGEELVLENPEDWTPISDLAYRTFHYSSLSRNFEAFVNKFSVLVVPQ